MRATHTLPALPRPGPLWGAYPEREHERLAPAPGGPPWWCPAGLHARRLVRQVRGLQATLPDTRELHTHTLRARLRRHGLAGPLLAEALAHVARQAEASLGLAPFDTQLHAAAVMLGGRLAEMATGEGKTLAVALAAAVAALAGSPVHALTANDYLAARDAQQLAPLFHALGLSVAAIEPGMGPQERRAVYAHDVVYATAKEVAFDYLRDRLAGRRDELQRHAHALASATSPLAAPRAGPPVPSEPPVLRGLCLALVDEADSILLDEAVVPLIVSRAAPHAGRRAFLWQALAVARRLAPGAYELHAAGQRAVLTPAGREEAARLTATLGGPWRRPRYRDEALQTALAALHLYQRDRDYLVREDDRGSQDGPGRRIEILDALTGRGAPGRVWSRGLHTAIEIKEGCPLSAETETAAQITFQRFFRRYLRLGGMSGTLWEARGELQRVYGLAVVRVPLRQKSRRRLLPVRGFADDTARWAAVAARCAELARQGRPVLVGTDSVGDSQALSQVLGATGVPHTVLNAHHDQEEAAIVARAGEPGCVTVATRMAGRGTDIALAGAARAAGGLHVIHCQHNGSRRQDRQLIGRCARQGAPGSAETWISTAPLPPTAGLPGSMKGAECRIHERDGGSRLSRRATAWLRLHLWVAQRIEEYRQAAGRRHLLEQDQRWERQRHTVGHTR